MIRLADRAAPPHRTGRAVRIPADEAAMVPLVYHPGYNITAFGLERLHPFDSRKYRRIHDALIRRACAAPATSSAPPGPSPGSPGGPRSRVPPVAPAPPDAGGHPGGADRPSRCPAGVIDWRVLRPMRLATGGTILACRLALEHGLAINLGGGYHHASGRLGRRLLRLRRRADGPGDPARRGHGPLGAGHGPGRPPGQRHRRRRSAAGTGCHVLDFYEETSSRCPKVARGLPAAAAAPAAAATHTCGSSSSTCPGAGPLPPRSRGLQCRLRRAGRRPAVPLRLTPAEMEQRDL